jgi:hypothetical protein
MKLYLKYEWNESTKSFVVSKGESEHKLELTKESRKVIREIVEDISANSGIKSKFTSIICLIFWILFLIFYIIFFVILSSTPTYSTISAYSSEKAANLTSQAPASQNITSSSEGYYTYSRVDVSSFGANNSIGIFLLEVLPFILFSILAMTFTRKPRQQLVRDYLHKQDLKYKQMLDKYNMALGTFFFEIEEAEDESDLHNEENQQDNQGGKKQKKKVGKPTEKKIQRGCLAGKLMVGALEFFDKGSELDRKASKNPKAAKSKTDVGEMSENGMAISQTGNGRMLSSDQVAVEIIHKVLPIDEAYWEKSTFVPDGLPILPSTMRANQPERPQMMTSAPQPVSRPTLLSTGYPFLPELPIDSARSQNPLLISSSSLARPYSPSASRRRRI